MYLALVDAPAGLMVGRQIGGGSGADDGTRMAQAVYELARAAVWPGRPKVYLLHIERDSPHPGPLERDQIAEAWRRVDASHTLFCVVSDSPVVRATFDVVSALRRQPKRTMGQVFATRAEALGWLEATGRPGIGGALAVLEARVRTALRAGSWGTRPVVVPIPPPGSTLRRS